MTKRISISFGQSGEGEMACEGLGSFACLGQAGRPYPKDLTVAPSDKSAEHWSDDFSALMKWCILIWGQKGIYIHEGPDNIKDNGGPSGGCIHLGSGNAKKVYDWLDERTRILIDYPWSQTMLSAGSAESIVTAARKYVDEKTVFANGCSEMVRSAYAAGGITIPGDYTADIIMKKCPVVASPLPGDIAGWEASDGKPAHVVIYLGPNSFANCPGPGKATKHNSNMGESVSYRRPS